MSDDDDLVARLRRIAAEVDGVPAQVDEAARAAFLTRRLDDEIATLLRDSATAVSAVRGPDTGPRMLSYEFGEVSLELELEVDGRSATRLRGLVLGATGPVEVDTGPAVTRTAEPDDLGWFTVDALPPGPFRVRVRASDGTPVSTGWLQA